MRLFAQHEIRYIRQRTDLFNGRNVGAYKVDYEKVTTYTHTDHTDFVVTYDQIALKVNDYKHKLQWNHFSI